MFDLFYQGGPLFMGMLTLIFMAMLATAVINSMPVLRQETVAADTARKLGYIKSVGLFALVVGILGQMLGLYDAFKGIEQMGAISPAMLAGGLKVSMITTLYGILIYAVSLLIWLGISFKLKQA